MPAGSAPVSRQPVAIAPDGIAIHGFGVPPAWLVSVVEGRIPPGEFGIHRHLTLDQYTYVIEGAVIATTDGTETALPAGGLLLTVAGESLQFANRTESEARVLFICAPPYPADDSDTVTLPAHRPLPPEEYVAVRQRLLALRAAIIAAIDARLAALD